MFNDLSLTVANWEISQSCVDELKDRFTQSDGTVSEINRKPFEPRVFVVAECVSDTIYDPFTDTEIPKSELSYIVVLIDFLSVLIVLIYTWWLESSQRAYVQVYKQNAIEMEDFALRIKGIPHQTKYGNNDEVLRAVLITHFT